MRQRTTPRLSGAASAFAAGMTGVRREEAQAIRSSPPMYLRSTSGTVIEPSASW